MIEEVLQFSCEVHQPAHSILAQFAFFFFFASDHGLDCDNYLM